MYFLMMELKKILIYLLKNLNLQKIFFIDINMNISIKSGMILGIYKNDLITTENFIFQETDANFCGKLEKFLRQS